VPCSYVSQLECSRTGDRYDADQLQGVSKVGAPLPARYDLDQPELATEAEAGVAAGDESR
jgi:hypothetical protein